MTFFIVARDRETQKVGMAIASRFLAAGSYCVNAASGVGAASSQARVNPLLGIDAIKGMAAGEPVDSLLARLMEADDGREIRQVHIVDIAGNTTAWTGADCVDWAGHETFEDFSVAGNMLAGPQVIAAMAAGYQAAPELSFPLRLLVAMNAGEAAGGDKRGKQSAAIYTMADQEYADLDLRVDDHVDPLPELRRLYEMTQTEHMQGYRMTLPKRR